MRGWEKRETHHWFDHSEISQIVEKNICCSVILSGLIQLKSTPRTEYIVLPYNTRASTLWTPFDGGILSCQKWIIQDNAYATSNKSFSIQKLTPQAEGRWTVIKMITVEKAQRTKGLLKSIFYRWYDQWTLSKSVKVQHFSKWGKFNSAQIKAVDGRSSPRLKTPHSTWRLSMMPRKLWWTILWYFAFFAINCTINTRHFVPSWNLIKTQKHPTARHRVAGCCYWRTLISE